MRSDADVRWPWQRTRERKTHIRVPSVEGAINFGRFVRQEYIRVNNHGRERTYICGTCASPYFNDYQWNAPLRRSVTCEQCGVTVLPKDDAYEEVRRDG
jgi:DNA-directed RNA polymerase subunit RPC12/RpoP